MKNAQSIFYLIGTTILLIVINTIFFLFQTSKNEKNHGDAMATYKVIEAASGLLNKLGDSEILQRGYVLSKESDFLKDFKTAERDLKDQFATLNSLLVNNTDQQSSLKRLNELIELKQLQSNRLIQEFHASGKINVLQRDNFERNELTASKIRNVVRTITSTEEKKLEVNNTLIATLTRRIQLFTVISNWILLIIVISALINIIRGREKIDKLFREVQNKNKQLESQKSELQILSQDLIKQNTELERFAHVASHDLRSPGVNLIALLQLYDEAKDDAERQNLIKLLKEVAENLLLKLDDLIDLLRTKHESEASFETLKFKHVYDMVEKNLTAQIKRTGAKISIDFMDAPEISYPKSYLESIIQNLLSNALKYRSPKRKPEIFIKSYKNRGKTFLEIKDNGLGIDLKQHGKSIFGIYKTFHNLKDSKGVGLYITKAQIVALGGTIDVKSTVDAGTTFTVCFN